MPRTEKYVWLSGTGDPDSPSTYISDYNSLSYKIDKYVQHGYVVLESGALTMQSNPYTPIFWCSMVLVTA